MPAKAGTHASIRERRNCRRGHALKLARIPTCVGMTLSKCNSLHLDDCVRHSHSIVVAAGGTRTLADVHVERAFAAMTDRSGRKADDDRRKVGLG